MSAREAPDLGAAMRAAEVALRRAWASGDRKPGEVRRYVMEFHATDEEARRMEQYARERAYLVSCRFYPHEGEEEEGKA